MTRPTLADRLDVARLGIGRARAASRVHWAAVPLLGRRVMRPVADHLMFVPSDLRPVDPSLLDELASGQMGLAGLVYEVRGRSPFALAGADPSWQRELNGFAWLGSLRAAASPEAQRIARDLVSDWIKRSRGRGGGARFAAEPEVIARRLVAWIVNAGFLLEGAPGDLYSTFTRTLGAELRALDLRTPIAAPGYPRLVCLLALTVACLAIAGHDRDLPRIERALIAEIERQVMGDGCHISRNGNVVVDLLLDLLPVSQCYAARGLVMPAPLNGAIGRLMACLRASSLTVRALARFNGVGVARPEALATVLALDGHATRPGSAIGLSGYARLARGRTTMLVDCGRPPPLAFATAAHAGCLSFELADGDEPVIVNRGAPGPAHRQLHADARATASHSTLTLADQSSAHLVRSRMIERLTGAPPISGPDRVEAHLSEHAGAITLAATHDGYVGRFGLVHERQLTLAADGGSLDGIDRLRPPRGTLRLARDVPFAVRFHVAVDAGIEGDPGGITIAPAGARPWRLTCAGCHVSVEAATDYAEVLGPTPARQIVLRATCPGEAAIAWRLARF